MEHVRYINGERRDLTKEECSILIERYITKLGYRKLTPEEAEKYKKEGEGACESTV